MDEVENERIGSRRSDRSIEFVFSGGRSSRRLSHSEEDEEALRWAVIEKLPTYDRLRTSIFKSFTGNDEIGQTHKQIDVRRLDMDDRRQFIDTVFKVAEEDNEKFLRKLRDRIDRVGIKLASVEVRFEELSVEAECHIGNRALPSLPNVARNVAESILNLDDFTAGSPIIRQNDLTFGAGWKIGPKLE
ncbi:ABC transporter G family member 36-like, partial [Momordica charantia]|uniref:ABC transporter G family member 36-like n=1 Tax=Momordica charantia TaxID=3673 RepID=A0A6J1DZP7_MOMCH